MYPSKTTGELLKCSELEGISHQANIFERNLHVILEQGLTGSPGSKGRFHGGGVPE